KSGGVLLGYGVELSVTYDSLLIRRVLAHLGRYGIAPEEVVVQTDRGGEFSGQERTRRGFGFVYTVRELCGAEHTYIPPRWPNANADTPSPNWSGHLGEVMLNLFEEEENGGISQGRRWAPAVHDRLQEGAD